MPRALTPTQQQFASAMAETELEENVRALCATMHGVLYYHPRRSEKSVKGYPDDTIVGASGVLFRELKTQTGKLSTDQQVWFAALTEAGQDVGVWRPEDWYSGRILEEVTAIGRGH